MINIVYLKNGLTPHLRKEEKVETTSIRDAEPNWSIPYVAFLDGKVILRKDWDIVIEGGDHTLLFIEADAIPQGGGGGGSDPLRTVLMIAVMVYAPQIAFSAFGTAGLTGEALAAAQVAFAHSAVGVFSTLAIQMAGMALVNAVVPVTPLSSNQQASLAAPSPTYNIQAQGNNARIGSAIPEQFGRLRVYPDFAAEPYTEYIGNEQYVYQVLCLGVGEYLLEDIKIEDTPIANFNDVTTWVIPPYTPVYPSTRISTSVVNSLEVSGQEVQSFDATYDTNGTTEILVKLVNHGITMTSTINVTFTNGGTVPNTTFKEVTIVRIDSADTFTITTGNTYIAGTNNGIIVTIILGYFIANPEGTLVDKLSFDFAAPRGLYNARDDGSLATVTIYPVIEYRQVDDYGNFIPGSVWASPGTTITLGWSSWAVYSTSTAYIAPPANTTDTEYYVEAIIGGTKTSTSGSDYTTVYPGARETIQVTGPVPINTTYNIDGNNSMLIQEVSLYTVKSRSKIQILASQYSGNTTTPQRWTVPVDVIPGRYACRVYRSGTSAASTNSRLADTFVWAGLRSYKPEAELATYTKSSNLVTVTSIGHSFVPQNPATIEFISTATIGGDYAPSTALPVVNKYTVLSVTDSTFTFDFTEHTISGPYDPTVLHIYRDHGNVTLLALKMRASNSLSVQASRKINALLTRKLPTWSIVNGSVIWGNAVATRSVSEAIIYTAKQIGMSDAQIDYTGISAIGNARNALGEYFDGRFDNFVSFWEAVTKIATTIRSKPFLQAGILRIIRDEEATIPIALFSQRNIVKNSLSINYLMPTEDTAKKVSVSYFDSINWKPSTVNAYLGTTDPKTKAVTLDMFGITDRAHAYNEGLYQVATNLYRRKIIKFQTEMEGFIPTFGDLIIIQHDMPAWGQSGEILNWDSTTKTLTLSQEPEWTTGQTHYIALRSSTGGIQGDDAFIVTAHPTDPFKVIIGTSKLQNLAYSGTPYFGLGMERTHYAFGPGESWRQPAKVIAVRPQSFTIVEIECINEDNSVHNVQNYANPVPPARYSNFNKFNFLPSITGLKVERIYNEPTKLLISWNPCTNIDHYLVEQQDSSGTWVLLGEYKTSVATVDIIGNAGSKIRVAGATITDIGAWTETSLPGSLLLNITGFTTCNIKRVRKNLEITPLVDTLPSSFKYFEVRVYQDPGSGDFWDSIDPLIQRTTTINSCTFDMTSFGPPRLSELGIKYRVACRAVDTQGNYSDVSILGEYLLKNLI